MLFQRAADVGEEARVAASRWLGQHRGRERQHRRADRRCGREGRPAAGTRPRPRPAQPDRPHGQRNSIESGTSSLVFSIPSASIRLATRCRSVALVATGKFSAMRWSRRRGDLGVGGQNLLDRGGISLRPMPAPWRWPAERACRVRVLLGPRLGGARTAGGSPSSPVLRAPSDCSEPVTNGSTARIRVDRVAAAAAMPGNGHGPRTSPTTGSRRPAARARRSWSRSGCCW